MSGCPAYIFEVDTYNPQTEAVETLYYSTGRGFTTEPTEAPAITEYMGKVCSPGTLDRQVLESWRDNVGKFNAGDIELADASGELDGLIDRAFDGREVRGKYGIEPALSGFAPVYTGTMLPPEFAANVLRLKVVDKLEALNVPLLSAKYAGDNSGPTGIEGSPGDNVGGKLKAAWFGLRRGVAVTRVNSSLEIYALHSLGPISQVLRVADKDVELAFYQNFANLAALQAATVPAGQYATCLALGLIRLGSAPAGTVTVDARGDATGGYAGTAAQIARRIVKFAGWPDAGVFEAAFTALDALQGWECGVYVDSETTVAQLLGLVLAPLGLLFINNAGLLSVDRLKFPLGASVATFGPDETANQQKALQRVNRGSKEEDVPNWKVTVKYQRNHTVMTGDQVAGSVSASRKDWLGSEWSTAEASDDSIKTVHLLSQELVVETALDSATDAQALANELLAVRGVRRDTFEFPSHVSNTKTLDIGSVVTLTHGPAQGRKFVVLRLGQRFKDQITELRVYG